MPLSLVPMSKHPPAGAKWQSCTATGIKAGAVMTAAKAGISWTFSSPAGEYHLRLPVSVMNQCTFRELIRQVLL